MPPPSMSCSGGGCRGPVNSGHRRGIFDKTAKSQPSLKFSAGFEISKFEKGVNETMALSQRWTARSGGGAVSPARDRSSGSFPTSLAALGDQGLAIPVIFSLKNKTETALGITNSTTLFNIDSLNTEISGFSQEGARGWHLAGPSLCQTHSGQTWSASPLRGDRKEWSRTTARPNLSVKANVWQDVQLVLIPVRVQWYALCPIIPGALGVIATIYPRPVLRVYPVQVLGRHLPGHAR